MTLKKKMNASQTQHDQLSTIDWHDEHNFFLFILYVSFVLMLHISP